MANINPIREILSNPNEVSPTEYDFTPVSEETILTGITTVKVGLDDANNELEVEVLFVGDAPKATFLANPKAEILIGDISYPASSMIDLGAGLAAAGVSALGSEANTQADYATFLANKRIEIRY